MESRRNGPQLSSRHDDDDDDVLIGIVTGLACLFVCLSVRYFEKGPKRFLGLRSNYCTNFLLIR